MDRSDPLDKQSYGRTNILPMVKRPNSKALCSTVLKQEGLQVRQMSDGSIGSIGQAILRSNKYFTDGEMHGMSCKLS